MATDGPDPAPCDPEVFKKGKDIFMTHSIPSNAMEGWVKKVANLSGQKVDWYFFGGRAIVKALGDCDKVVDVINQLLPEHDELYKKAVADLHIGFEPDPPRYFF